MPEDAPADIKPAPKRRGKAKKRVVNLALQGGGAHGAFTWGVLDRLLEDPDLEIEGVSATSAGAMNGAMLTTGYKIGGRDEARRRLGEFWGRISDSHPFNKPPFSLWMQAFHPVSEPFAIDMNPAFVLGDVVSRVISPYQFNPAGTNPLRPILEEMIDFSKVCRMDDPRLFVCATHVRSGRAHIFMGEDISTDALLASACLPTLYQAVTIDGEDYWDGGYTGNPPIWPLVYHCDSEDVIVVHINPIERDETPKDARAILNRINEISFNSNLMGEMRAIETIARLVDAGKLPIEKYKRMRIHAIEDQETMRRLSSSTKLTPDNRLLMVLHDAGRAAANRWLAEHRNALGVESSVDIREKYL